MSMNKIKSGVEQLVQTELDLASAQHGERFRSPHEAYAVIKEEQEEADLDLQELRVPFLDFWRKVKNNRDGSSELQDIKELAVNAACECIQVAAMAEKALRGYEVEKK